MKTHLCIGITLMAGLFLSCAKPDPEIADVDNPVVEIPSNLDTQEPEQKNMTIEILIGNKTFQADIEDSETGRAFLSLLPMKLSMSELNANEKYHYLSSGLPAKPQHYSSIAAGDLMLFGESCVVLFYDSAGGYSYTRIGKLKSTSGLAEAVGKGTISVDFKKP